MVQFTVCWGKLLNLSCHDPVNKEGESKQITNLTHTTHTKTQSGDAFYHSHTHTRLHTYMGMTLGHTGSNPRSEGRRV